MINFDTNTHTYSKNGIAIPGVTNILECAGLSDFSMVSDEVLTRSINFGNAVHKTCNLYDQNLLDESILDPILNKCLDNWKTFKKDFKVKIVDHWIEYLVYSEKYNYAGTLDYACYINDKLSILDIKTGVRSRAHQIQTAAYENAFRRKENISRNAMPRYTIYITDAGYKLERNNSISDFNIFLSALQLYNYKRSK